MQAPRRSPSCRHLPTRLPGAPEQTLIDVRQRANELVVKQLREELREGFVHPRAVVTLTIHEERGRAVRAATNGAFEVGLDTLLGSTVGDRLHRFVDVGPDD